MVWLWDKLVRHDFQYSKLQTLWESSSFYDYVWGKMSKLPIADGNISHWMLYIID